jgi:hypothetical protein
MTDVDSEKPTAIDDAKVYHLRQAAALAAPLDEVFAFFSEAANLQRITPDWLHFDIRDVDGEPIGEGTRIDYRLKVRGVPMRWRSRIERWQPPHRFVDRQLRGPYKLWVHEHTFEAVDGGTLCRDHVRYQVPGGPLAPLTHRLLVRPDVDRIFAHRTAVLRELFGQIPGFIGTDQTSELPDKHGP